jgi:hypothetical protein
MIELVLIVVAIAIAFVAAVFVISELECETAHLRMLSVCYRIDMDTMTRVQRKRFLFYDKLQRNTSLPFPAAMEYGTLFDRDGNATTITEFLDAPEDSYVVIKHDSRVQVLQMTGSGFKPAKGDIATYLMLTS